MNQTTESHDASANIVSLHNAAIRLPLPMTAEIRETLAVAERKVTDITTLADVASSLVMASRVSGDVYRVSWKLLQRAAVIGLPEVSIVTADSKGTTKTTKRTQKVSEFVAGLALDGQFASAAIWCASIVQLESNDPAFRACNIGERTDYSAAKVKMFRTAWLRAKKESDELYRKVLLKRLTEVAANISPTTTQKDIADACENVFAVEPGDATETPAEVVTPEEAKERKERQTLQDCTNPPSSEETKAQLTKRLDACRSLLAKLSGEDVSLAEKIEEAKAVIEAAERRREVIADQTRDLIDPAIAALTEAIAKKPDAPKAPAKKETKLIDTARGAFKVTSRTYDKWALATPNMRQAFERDWISKPADYIGKVEVVRKGKAPKAAK